MMSRLLNFKVDHQSIRVFDGVDYQEKKKEKDRQLKQLMLQEMEMEQTRRKRKVVTTAEPAKDEAPQHKNTHVVRLPFMQPFQVPVSRVVKRSSIKKHGLRSWRRWQRRTRRTRRIPAVRGCGCRRKKRKS